MALTAKQVDYIFKETLNVHIIVGQLFLSSVVDSRSKQSQDEKTISFEQQIEVGEHNTLDTQSTLIIFLSAIAVI